MLQDVVAAPASDDALAHQAEQIHTQVFGPQGGHFLGGGRVKLAGGETYDVPPQYPRTGNPNTMQ